MTRTQIQLPDTLYSQLKDIAEQREMSMAELVRRGMEKYVSTIYIEKTPTSHWSFPLLPPRDMIGKPEDINHEAEIQIERAS